MRVVDNIFELNSVYNLMDAVYKNEEIEKKGVFEDFVEELDKRIFLLREQFDVERMTAYFKGNHHLILKLNKKGEVPLSTFVFVERLNVETIVCYAVSNDGVLEMLDFQQGGNFPIFINDEIGVELFNIEKFLRSIENFTEIDIMRYRNLYEFNFKKDNLLLKDSPRYNFEIEGDGNTLFHDKLSGKVSVNKINETELPLLTYGRFDDNVDRHFYILGLDYKMYVVNGILCSTSTFLKTDPETDVRNLIEGVVKMGTHKLIQVRESIELVNAPLIIEDSEGDIITYTMVRLNELKDKFDAYKYGDVIKDDTSARDTFLSSEVIPLFQNFTDRVVEILSRVLEDGGNDLVNKYVEGAGRCLDYLLMSPSLHESARQVALDKFKSLLSMGEENETEWLKVNSMRIISFLESRIPLNIESVKDIMDNLKITADKAMDKTGTFFTNTFSNIAEAVKTLPVLIERLTKLISEYKKTQKIRAREKMLNDEIIPSLKIITATLLGGITAGGVWYFVNPFMGLLAGFIAFVIKYRMDKIEEDTIKRFIVDEMEIIDIKIEQARSKGDDQAVIKLNRLKKELADKGGVIDQNRWKK